MLNQQARVKPSQVLLISSDNWLSHLLQEWNYPLSFFTEDTKLFFFLQYPLSIINVFYGSLRTKWLTFLNTEKVKSSLEITFKYY